MTSHRGQAHQPLGCELRLPLSGVPATTRRRALALCALALLATGTASSTGTAASPEGQLTWGVHVSLAPTWFDPAEMSGIITPYMVYYALHDALVKPMPGEPAAPSLAESWSLSHDGLTYEFVLRKGAKCHNGEAVTSEDVNGAGPRVGQSGLGLIAGTLTRRPTRMSRLRTRNEGEVQ